jgi:hypothetical protein
MLRRHFLMGATTAASPKLITNITDINNLGSGYLRMVFNIKTFGAIGDGSSHPANNRFATLAACQAVYPAATSLNQELDFLSIQLALNTATQFGGGVVYVTPGSYLLSAPGLAWNGTTVALIGAGPRVSILKCYNCGTFPAISLTSPTLVSGDGFVAVSNIGLWGFNDSVHIGGTQNSNGVAHTAFQSGSRAIYLSSIITINFENVAFFNFDVPTDFDVIKGNVWNIRFDSCMFSYNNKGFVVNAAAPNAFERMVWLNCVSGNNNYGAYFNFTDKPSVGGASQGADAYLDGCAIDYNVLWTVYYLGGTSAGNDIVNMLGISNCHLETSTTTSGSVNPRIFNDGNLTMRGCMGYEGATNPVGWITGSYYARTTVHGCLVPGVGSPGIPIYYSTGTSAGYIRGGGNMNRYGGDAMLIQDQTGCRMDTPADDLAASIITSGPIQTSYAIQRRINILTANSVAYPIQVLEDSIANHMIGIIISFVTTGTSQWTFVPDSGVIITSTGTSLSFGGAGKKVFLTKTASSTWLAYGEMT